MSQQNGWMTHSISTCASCKQIPFIYTRHTPGFFRMFCWWLVMEFQNPAPEAGRLLKTAQTLDKQTHPCGGSPPAPAADRARSCSPQRGWGRLSSHPSSGNSAIQPRSFSHPPVGPAPRNIRFRVQSLLFYRSPLISPMKAQMSPFKCKLALHF